MRFVVITGLSGAGKTLALHTLEDAGCYTVDNLPPTLLPELFDFCEKEGISRCAVVCDSRGGSNLVELPSVFSNLKSKSKSVEMLFLDASNESLVQRYKETRRPHPLHRGVLAEAVHSSILDAIQKERELLLEARSIADGILDTSSTGPLAFRDTLGEMYSMETRPVLLISIISFGFKYGIPMEADLVFDVRFLANPHYVPELKGKDGRDPEVLAYVQADSRTKELQQKMEDLILFTLPQYREEGKAYLNIAIGCTGGKHRSVALAEQLALRIEEKGFKSQVRHRDLEINEASLRKAELYNGSSNVSMGEKIR